MRQLQLKKIISTVLLLVLIFGGAIWNLQKNLQQLIKTWQTSLETTADSSEGDQTIISNLEAEMQDDLIGKYFFVEGYGYLQKLLSKEEVNNFEVVQDESGSLHYTYFTTGPNDVTELTDRMARLEQVAAKNGSQVMYLMTPDKFIKGETEFETGMPYNYANETADAFLRQLAEKQVNYLDYREIMKAEGELTSDSFYLTDHHWKIEVAFQAYVHLLETMNETYNQDFVKQSFMTDLANFNQITYQNAYIGSMARKTGQLYTEPEDFTVIYPKFDTNFYVYSKSGSQETKADGTFEDVIINSSILSSNGDKYDVQLDKYFSYMNGNPGFIQLTNLENEDGPRVLFIKDSLIVPVASFLSLETSQTTLVDPRYFDGNIEELVESDDYDYIFVTFSPQNLTETFFPFYEEE